jgi:DNA-binding transcriptional ArsR family regulator
VTDRETAALRATAHPLRLQILSLLTGASMSAAEVARELGTTQANASYHLRVLADAGEVVPDGEESVRGGVAKKYRHPWEALREDASRPRTDLVRHVRAMGQELARRWAQKQPRTRAVLTDAEMWVSPETWKRVRALVEEASTLVHAEAVTPRSTGSVHVNVQIAAFQMEDR